MLSRKGNVLNVKAIYSAFSLVEILLSLALGTVILMIMVGLYSQLYRGDDKYLEKINIQMQAHQLMDYFKQHLQHSGYLGQNRQETNYDQFLMENKSYQVNQNCLQFFYDVNQDGYIGSRKSKTLQEIFAFKLENKEIFSYKLDTSKEAYQNYLKQRHLICGIQKGWESMTKDFRFTVNMLNFIKRAENIIQIDIELNSRKYPKLSYQITAYTYLLNGLQ